MTMMRLQEAERVAARRAQRESLVLALPEGAPVRAVLRRVLRGTPERPGRPAPTPKRQERAVPLP